MRGVAIKPPIFASTSSVRNTLVRLKSKKIARESVVSLDEYRTAKEWIGREQSIIIADQSEVSREGLKRYLQAERFAVELANDALHLSDLIEVRQVDLIIINSDLPWIDGRELCQLLKGHPVTNRTPIILTGEGKSEEFIQSCFHCGCNEYLQVPYKHDAVALALDKIFGEKIKNI